MVFIIPNILLYLCNLTKLISQNMKSSHEIITHKIHESSPLTGNNDILNYFHISRKLLVKLKAENAGFGDWCIISLQPGKKKKKFSINFRIFGSYEFYVNENSSHNHHIYSVSNPKRGIDKIKCINSHTYNVMTKVHQLKNNCFQNKVQTLY